MMHGGIGPLELLVLVFVMLVMVWPCWRICTKAGLPGPLGLICLIPCGLLVLLYLWALLDWPALTRHVSGAEHEAR